MVVTQTVFLGESAGLQEGDLPLLFQILLVADQHNDDVWTGQGPRVCQPVCQGIVGLSTVKIFQNLLASFKHAAASPTIHLPKNTCTCKQTFYKYSNQVS